MSYLRFSSINKLADLSETRPGQTHILIGHRNTPSRAEILSGYRSRESTQATTARPATWRPGQRSILDQIKYIAQNYQHSVDRPERLRGDTPTPDHSSNQPAGRVTERGPKQSGRHRQQQQ